MIRYSLACEREHGFEAWFRSSADFDSQSERGFLSCPTCGSGEVRKALMAPAISSGARGPEMDAPAPVAEQAAPAAEVALVSDKERELRSMLRAVRDHVTKTSENVGERFPELARAMHAEEIEHRSIYGRATAEEAKALADEGVEVHPLPRFPDEAN